MRSLRKIKKSIGRAGIQTKPQVDEAMLRHLLQELTTATTRASNSGPRRAERILSWGRLVPALAAAALIILALIVFGRTPQRVASPPRSRTLSAADLLTVGGLNAACRRGGLEALDRQCEEAARRLDTVPERVSVKTLIRDLQGI